MDTGGTQPGVRHGSDVVLGGEGLEDGDGEAEGLGPLADLLLGKHKVLRVVDVLVHRVLETQKPEYKHWENKTRSRNGKKNPKTQKLKNPKKTQNPKTPKNCKTQKP